MTLTGGSNLQNINRRVAIQSTIASTIVWLQAGEPSNAAYIDPTIDSPKVTKRVYLDVQIGDKPSERLVIGLFGELMPRAVENFDKLCAGNSYAGTTFYRVLSGNTIQGGAIGDPTGKSGQSAFGSPFEPDNYNLKHTKTGLVSAVRGIGGAADSRFFINCNADAGWADDRYAAFGIVEEGLDFVNDSA
jgi:peptidyl-prolyl cis-trans isomerase B (cyclophilin B)